MFRRNPSFLSLSVYKEPVEPGPSRWGLQVRPSFQSSFSSRTPSDGKFSAFVAVRDAEASVLFFLPAALFRSNL